MEEKKCEWLTEEICREYIKRAKELSPNNGLDIGQWRDLRIELQQRCNLPEIQAYNIIHGFHVREYVHMYDILSGKIPMPEVMKKKLEMFSSILEKPSILRFIRLKTERLFLRR